MTTTPESIAALRALFEAELSKPERAKLYHQVDIGRVRTDDWQVKRFLLAHEQDQTKAFAALTAALQWKKSYGIHQLSEASFPKQFWVMVGSEVCGADRDGHLLNWNVLRRYIKFKNPAARRLNQQFLAFINERCDVAAGETGYVTVTDTTGAGISNVSIEDIQFLIKCLEHYPLGLRTTYMVNLPWILNSIVKFILTLMPAKLRDTFKFISAEDLHAIVESKYIPLSLKGTREKTIYPSGLPNLEECYQQLGMDEKVVAALQKSVAID